MSKSARHFFGGLGHPIGPLIYTISCMHCMAVSLAQDGAGLGAARGVELAQQMLRQSGFSNIDIHRLEHDFQNAYFVNRKVDLVIDLC